MVKALLRGRNPDPPGTGAAREPAATTDGLVAATAVPAPASAVLAPAQGLVKPRGGVVQQTEPEGPGRLVEPVRAPSVCRYPKHRGSDWLSVYGVRVCGVCHPPAVAELVVKRTGTSEAA